MNNTEQLEAMANEMGISLFQRFSESDGAKFLGVSVESLSTARNQHKLAYLQLEGQPIEYFGSHLLVYLLGAVQGASITNTIPDRILRSQEVTQMTGLSRTTLWRMENEGHFPSRVSLGVGSVGWKLSEVEEWLFTRK